MLVEYIQPVCPYCNRGLSPYETCTDPPKVPTTERDTNGDYFCSAHGSIEARLVRYVKCAHEKGTVLSPAPYETCTDWHAT